MFAQWEIPYRSLVVQREASAPIEITAEIIDSGSVVLKLFKDILRLLQIFPAFLNLLIDGRIAMMNIQVSLAEESILQLNR